VVTPEKEPVVERFEKETKNEIISNPAVRHVRFSNTEADLTPSKTSRMSKLLSIQGIQM
jgi:hypothetical protein